MMTQRSKAEAAVQKWIEWAARGGVEIPTDQVVADVIEAHASGLVPQGAWLPISSLPNGRHVELYWQDGEKGVGGIECATVFFDEGTREGPWSYWTHGGPNSGYDWEPRDGEKPTHWRPLPEPP